MNNELFLPRQCFGGIPARYSKFESSSVVVLPIPYDSTVEWHSGTREGPRSIINASQYLELYDIEMDREFHSIGIHTLPEVEPIMDSPEQMVDRVHHIVTNLLESNKFIVMIGGEHSLTVGMVRAIAKQFQDICVLQLDAHADLRDEYLGTKYSHACTMRRVVELCPITQVGIRSLSLEEHDFLSQYGKEPYYADGLVLDAGFWDSLLNSLSSTVYISIDIDVLDPSIMPAVGTPEPGGLGWYQLLSILRKVTSQKRVVGIDLVELCPNQGPSSCAYLAAKLVYKLIGYAASNKSFSVCG
ncbi:MAG: agmatinase [Chloroflexota bacterium]|nr:agmatinase [Chloroflexota bacterium]